MSINTYLIRGSFMIMLIFGGTLIIRYAKTNEVLLDSLLAFTMGALFLISAIIWRKR